MWIFFNDSMLSIVKKEDDVGTLTVRARAKGDIECVFPNAEVVEDAGTDYFYRAKVARDEVAKALFDRTMDLNYGNFKSSVEEGARHEAYFKVWRAMYVFQGRG